MLEVFLSFFKRHIKILFTKITLGDKTLLDANEKLYDWPLNYFPFFKLFDKAKYISVLLPVLRSSLLTAKKDKIDFYF